MDENQQHMQTPVAGDDDLAKALGATDDDQTMKFEQSPMASIVTPEEVASQPASTADDVPVDDLSTPTIPTLAPADEPDDKPAEVEAKTEEPAITPSEHITTTGNSDLDKIKDEVIKEMKPLVGKLDLPAEEKFDTLLLIIRSTDDEAMLQATFDAAKEITDETKRAKALLDVMREVSYFSSKK